MAKVSIVKIPEVPLDEEVFEGVQRSISMLGGAERFASAGNKVFIKPNILSPSFVGITDRRVTYAVAKIFKNLGCDVSIGENPLVATKSSEVFEKTLYPEVAKRAGVKFVDLRRDDQEVVKVPNAKGCETLKVAKSILDADLVVSIPAMKVHGMCFVTLSLKNMWGTIPPTQRQIGHLKSLHWTLAELNKIIGTKLAIIDGITAVGYRGAFPQGLIIAGDDPVAADTITTMRMGLDPRRIEHIRYAHELGVGEMDPKKIELIGAKLEDIVKEGKNLGKLNFVEPWMKPTRLVAGLKNVRIVNGNACDSCLRKLRNAIKAVGLQKLAKGPQMTVLIGPDAEPVEGGKLLIVGHCLQRYADRGVFIDYCSAYDPDIQHGIEVILGEKKEAKMLWDELLQKTEKGLPGS
jgi:uncharacterized protein (DUF362 family)